MPDVGQQLLETMFETAMEPAMRRLAELTTALVSILVPCSATHADIVVCNDFRVRVRVALAYEQPAGISAAGWWSVEPKACKDIDFAFTGAFFYYTADSDSYKERRKTMTDHWGNKKELFVPSKDFKTDDAGRKGRNAGPVKFSQVELTQQQQAKPVVITLRFSSGSTTTEIKLK
jgi:uncharacterized membrane protein